MVVLWSFRKGDVQLGSTEDLRQAEHNRRQARAMGCLAKAIRKHRLMIDNMSSPAREVTARMHRYFK